MFRRMTFRCHNMSFIMNKSFDTATNTTNAFMIYIFSIHFQTISYGLFLGNIIQFMMTRKEHNICVFSCWQPMHEPELIFDTYSQSFHIPAVPEYVPHKNVHNSKCCSNESTIVALYTFSYCYSHFCSAYVLIWFRKPCKALSSSSTYEYIIARAIWND